LVVPDLYEPFSVAAASDVGVPASVAGATFDQCVTVAPVPAAPPDTAGLLGLRLDPTLPADRERVVALQQRVVTAAEALGLVALLDVPPGLRPAQVLAWRAAFDSSYAAAWHGWLRVPSGVRLVTVPPTGSAAGIIAATELRSGLPTGPAQVTLATAVAAADGPGAGGTTTDTATLHQLHRAGLNVALPDRDGVFFTAARTLSADPQWRQLTARRVVTMVERSVASGLAWASFEPNDLTLRERIATAVDMLLRDLFDLGAFAGATPRDSFFVRAAPPAPAGAPSENSLVCEIGVAPSEPMEFLLVRVLRADDGTQGPAGAAA
jgi:phage tail sheath protein FI